MENENLNEAQLEETAAEIVEETEAAELPVTEQAQAEAPAEPETKKSKTGVIVLTVVLCLALLASLTVAVLAGTGVLFGDNTETTVADTTEPETTLPADLKFYTVDAETAKANADKVVATIGDVEMTNGELQACYRMGVYNFVSANQYYLAYMGVDFSKPLDTQVYDAENGISWQAFLLDQSLESWHLYTALNLLGKENGYELDEEGKAYLADMESSMKTMAEEEGYESVQAMVEDMVGPGTTEQGYKNYMAIADYAYRYYNQCAEDLENGVTPEFLEQYYTDNQESLNASGITKDAGDLVDIRHILIRPEGGTTDENNQTVYTDEAWEACRQKAQDLLDQWKSGEATEDAFAVLAKENTADSNADVGGLYEGVSEGQMVTEFNDWIFDESRAYGDTDLVKTQFGYHVMFFVDREPAWSRYTMQTYVQETLSEMVDAAYEKWPMEVNYDAVCLGEPNQGE